VIQKANSTKTAAILAALFFIVIEIPCKAQPSPPATDSAIISFTNPAIGFQVELEGLLQWPAQPGRYPLVVFIHGSGKGTRYEYGNMFSLFLNKGYAVFSYDKRGVNKSGGAYNGVGPKNSPMMIPLLASDAYEAIEIIKKRPEIDSSSVILVGASQAGWIIPVVASMSKSVSHYIIMYGPAVTVGEEIYYSRFAEGGEYSIKDAEKLMANYTGLKGFDPLPYIRQLKQKGLWIFGGKDMSIPTARSIQLLDSLNKISKRPYTIKLYRQASHGLINMETGLYEDYIPLIMDWLEKNRKMKSF
jgi:uncharacterized protein